MKWRSPWTGHGTRNLGDSGDTHLCKSPATYLPVGRAEGDSGSDFPPFPCLTVLDVPFE